MGIDEIITRAIPRENCPVKEAGAQHRREQLKIRIEQLLRDNSQPYKPNLEYKEEIAGYNEVIPSSGDFTISNALPHRE